MWTEEKILERITGSILGPLVKEGLALDFIQRFENRFPMLWKQYRELYGERFDCLYQLEDLVISMARMNMDRPDFLKAEREEIVLPRNSTAVMLYLDLFNRDLSGFRKKIDYLADLGINAVHLMPLFKVPEEDSDGGYAVSDYREVRADLGTMTELAEIAGEMRNRGMHLILDFVLNHTSDEHLWAREALSGNPEYQEYYFMFDTKEDADEYDRHLREIFPTVRKGSFTFRAECGKWVWTTFASFQWDLNYRNPALFRAMCEQMLFLSNRGVDVLRFDALAFTWKVKGTGCENLPGTHTLIRLFRSVTAIAAPGLTFLSEAIVHPDDVIRYISRDECELSYNPLQMATTWEALATRNTALLKKTFSPRFAIPADCRWVNYLRCHDDIGWTFCDNDAFSLGYDPFLHRKFLNNFYTGRFEGSFASGVPFQENIQTGDARISGTLASLAGLEKAMGTGDEEAVELALARIRMLYAFLFSLPGIPLLYSGDELALVNDYSYLNDEKKKHDSRWVHRFLFPWDMLEKVNQGYSSEISAFIKKIVRLRKENPALSGQMDLMDLKSSGLLGFSMSDGGSRILVLLNFTERNESVSGNTLRIYGGSVHYTDLISGRKIEGDLTPEPYGVYWLKEDDR